VLIRKKLWDKSFNFIDIFKSPCFVYTQGPFKDMGKSCFYLKVLSPVWQVQMGSKMGQKLRKRYLFPLYE
jgi:hypothetical protein